MREPANVNDDRRSRSGRKKNSSVTVLKVGGFPLLLFYRSSSPDTNLIVPSLVRLTNFIHFRQRSQASISSTSLFFGFVWNDLPILVGISA